MNSSKTHQHVFCRHAIDCYQDACHLLCVSSMCTSKNNITYYVDIHVLHKGSSNLHTHNNKSYKTKNNTQLPITKHTKFNLIIHISGCF